MKDKRNTKLFFILLTLMVLSGAGVAGTTYYAYATSQSQTAMQGGTPPAMPGGSSGDTSQMTPPDMSGSTDTSTTPPSPPDGQTNDGNMQTPPDMSSDTTKNQSSDQTQMTPPDMKGQMPSQSISLNTTEKVIISSCALMFTASGLYLVITKGCKAPLHTKTKKLVYLCGSAALSGAIAFGSVYGATQLISRSHSAPQMGQVSSDSVTATGATTVDGETVNQTGETYTSTNADENALLVTNGGSLTLDNATINKTSGDASNTESADFYGTNAAVLVQASSGATITNSTITTSAKVANAVFATGEDAIITISDSTITTTGESSSRGLDATYGGTINATNVIVTTQGGSCAALATDRGEGTVTATSSTLETNGAGSPVIYSTGDITITDSTGTANGAQCVVVEGKNSATVTNSTITSSGQGNRQDVDQCGVMIYQSMSGDASEGTGTLTATNSTLSIDKSSSYYKSAPMFFITNTDAVINLENTKLSYGSGVLLSAKGTDEWGTSGSNGGQVTLNATKQTLTGDVNVDNISTAVINLKEGSTLTGTVNGENTAQSITVAIDATSSWEVTGDSYVTALTLAGNDTSLIKSNGHTIYYDADANSWLNGKTVTLSDGGKLVPVKS